jgi:hypothetical protein
MPGTITKKPFVAPSSSLAANAAPRHSGIANYRRRFAYLRQCSYG